MATRLEKRMDDLLNDNEQKRLVKLNVGHDAKFIIFSDLHRGLWDNADDFSHHNQASYFKALEHYLQKDFALIHLGDIEELKENWSISKVLDKNSIHLNKEAEFHKKGNYFRVFGNHDSQYENQNTVKQHLHRFFPGLMVYEGILLQYGIFPDILLTHGHQGYLPVVTNLFEYIGLPIYRWWLNDVLNRKRTVNYETYCAIEKDENAFYTWTSVQKNTILVFGHTHRPLWGGDTIIDSYEKKLYTAVEKLNNEAKKHNVSVSLLKLDPITYGVQAIIDVINHCVKIIQGKMEEHGVCRAPKPLPLIYNTGCCIFKDGDITGIEIENGYLRLIKWGANEEKNKIVRVVLEETYLGSLVIA